MSMTQRELAKMQHRVDAWEKLHMPTRITQTVRVMNPTQKNVGQW